MDIESLAFFLRIHELGGVAIAGQDFGYSPATSSTRLTALEDYYKAKLIVRTTRALNFTEEGELLLEHARQIVAEAAEVRQKILQSEQRLSGPIKISATHDFGRQTLMPIMDEFIDTHPDISLSLVLDDGHVDLVAQGVDLALRLGKLKDSTLVSKKVGGNRRVVCAAPAYLKKHGEPLRPRDLSAHNCLLMQFNNKIDNDWKFRVSGRQKVFRVTGNRRANNGALVRTWCLQGKGIALKSIWDVKDDIKAGRLVEILTDFAPHTGEILQIVYPGGGKPSRRVKAVIEHLTLSFNKRAG